MEAQNNNYFEKAWQQAMNGAEVTPRPEIWEGIEARLDQGGGYGKRIWLLKLAIAASVLFAMTTAGLYFTAKPGQHGVSEFTSDTGKKTESAIPETPDNTGLLSESTAPSKDDKVNAPSKMKTSKMPVPVLSEPRGRDEQLTGDNVFGETEPVQWVVFDAPSIDGLNPFVAVTIELPSEVIFQRVLTLPQPKDLANNHLWAGLNVAGGSLNSSAGSVSTLQVADFDNTAGNVMVGKTETQTTGTVMNVGLGLGKRIARRWVIQGGLNYSQRTASGTSNLVSGSSNVQSVAMELKQSQDNAQLTVTEPYDVNHTISYVSVPVQVGYVLLDKKVDITLLGGISNDILMQHKVSDADGNLASTTLNEDSNFSKYAVSALASAEVSYPLGKHYTISAYPQIRQYLTEVQKDVNSNPPLSLEMGFRLSYVF